MNPRVSKVQAAEDFHVKLTFDNGEARIFDVSPYLSRGIFQDLKEPTYFGRVKVAFGSIEWPGGQDFCPDTLYEFSKPVVSS